MGTKNYKINNCNRFYLKRTGLLKRFIDKGNIIQLQRTKVNRIVLETTL